MCGVTMSFFSFIVQRDFRIFQVHSDKWEHIYGIFSQIILKVFNEYDILGGQLLSQVPSSSEDPVYLAYFAEGVYTAGHYQAIRRKLSQDGGVQMVVESLLGTQDFLPAEASTARKRQRSPSDVGTVPVLKLRRTTGRWRSTDSTPPSKHEVRLLPFFVLYS